MKTLDTINVNHHIFKPNIKKLTLIASTLMTILVGIFLSILFFYKMRLTQEIIMYGIFGIILLYIAIITINFKIHHLFLVHYKNKLEYQEIKEALSLKKNKLSLLLEQAPIGIFYYDKNLKILDYNVLFYKIFGLKKEIKGFDLNNLNDKKAINIIKHTIFKKGTKKYLGSYNFSFQDTKVWADLTCSALLDEDGEIIGGIGIVQDKTSEHKSQERINYISHHDYLTTLPNRRSYKDYMIKMIHEERHQKEHSLLFYMDLNHFKQINDTFGHSVGDKLLIEVANRLKLLSLSPSHISRLGGDEFVLVVPFVSDCKDETKKKALEIANTLKDLFRPVFSIEGIALYMTSSIGVVIINPKVLDLNTIIRQADMAMYQTKRKGHDNISFYNESLDLERRNIISVQHDLNYALQNNQLELHYQPIVSIKDDKLNAMEALIRWIHPTKGIIPPDEFIPIATESGLISKIGWWIVESACKQIVDWREKNLLNFDYIAININARQLHEMNFTEHTNELIKKYDIPPSFIKFEVTETTLIDNFAKTQEIIKSLKSNGIELSIDDFGTGYSSLSYLKKLSFHILKIDRIFINDIVKNIDDQELVKSIIGIGKQFHYKVIVEGIENNEQKDVLMKINPEISYQGFLCSKAIPANEFEAKFLKAS